MQPDGDAPYHNGRPLFCRDDEDTGAIRVCVENDDSTSACQTCGGPTVYPGCPCGPNGECGPDLSCWGYNDERGRCYPGNEEPPQWICPYDCEAQYGDGAWCFSQHDSGQARCMDYTVSAIDVDACWVSTGPLIPNLDYPEDSDDACVPECTTTADCATWGFPSLYTCMFEVGGNQVCQRPVGSP
jgi:hypothetical protein